MGLLVSSCDSEESPKRHTIRLSNDENSTHQFLAELESSISDISSYFSHQEPVFLVSMSWNVLSFEVLTEVLCRLWHETLLKYGALTFVQ